MLNRKYRALTLMVVGFGAAACGGKPAASSDAANPAAGGAATAGGAVAKPTGKIVVVELITDAVGNYFKPAEFEVHRGDVIRYTLSVGVHNVHFLPDSNPGKLNLPPVSEFLQLPGQTFDVPVNFEPGTYYFQCDPHVLLGMKGHVKVER